MKNIKRCSWAKLNNPLYIKYHDEEWGEPVHSDKKLFEMLILEGAQAGLTWESILNRRETYRIAFDNFDIGKVASYDLNKVNGLLQDKGIIRNKLKIKSAITNAIVALKIINEFGSLDTYFWKFVDNKPIQNHFKNPKEIPTENEISKKLSKDLKKRGMSFVGPTIMYAFMQATGMVNDHTKDCFKYNA